MRGNVLSQIIKCVRCYIGALEEVVIVKRNVEENIEQGKMK